MLYVLTSQSGGFLNFTSLSRETNISLPTLIKHLNLLEETHVIKRISPYSKIRAVEIRKNPKIFFYDSGLVSLLWFGYFQNQKRKRFNTDGSKS